MADQRGGGISWTEQTWNPVRGCSRVSEGCRYCYAEVVAARFSGPGQPYEGLAKSTPAGPRWTGEVRLVPEHLTDPLRWRRPRMVFVNSMSDLFHEKLPDEVIDQVFAVMMLAREHTFQVLTKRPERMRDYMLGVQGGEGFGRLNDVAREVSGRDGIAVLPNQRHGMVEDNWPPSNVWLGTSAEDQRTFDQRIGFLAEAPAAVRFLSYEPALGGLDLGEAIERIDHCGSCGAENEPQGPDRCPACGAENTLISTWGFEQADRYRTGERYHGGRPIQPEDDGPRLHWVIVGGESGANARPFDIAWARQAVAQCRDAGVACFVKQLGSKPLSTREEKGWLPLFHDHYGREPAGEWAPAFGDRKGGDPEEWPEDLRVRQFPEPAAP